MPIQLQPSMVQQHVADLRHQAARRHLARQAAPATINRAHGSATRRIRVILAALTAPTTRAEA